VISRPPSCRGSRRRGGESACAGPQLRSHACGQELPVHKERKRWVAKCGTEDDQGPRRHDELYRRAGGAGDIGLEAENRYRASFVQTAGKDAGVRMTCGPGRQRLVELRAKGRDQWGLSVTICAHGIATASQSPWRSTDVALEARRAANAFTVSFRRPTSSDFEGRVARSKVEAELKNVKRPTRCSERENLINAPKDEGRPARSVGRLHRADGEHL
jgi:hypothetical protein